MKKYTYLNQACFSSEVIWFTQDQIIRLKITDYSFLLHPLTIPQLWTFYGSGWGKKRGKARGGS